MKYADGRKIELGDIISLDIPDGFREARVVMLGDTGAHLDIDAEFLSWVGAENLVNESNLVVEWVGGNPFEHNDPNYAPVGKYMFTGIDEWVTLVRRNENYQ